MGDYYNRGGYSGGWRGGGGGRGGGRYNDQPYQGGRGYYDDGYQGGRGPPRGGYQGGYQGPGPRGQWWWCCLHKSPECHQPAARLAGAYVWFLHVTQHYGSSPRVSDRAQSNCCNCIACCEGYQHGDGAAWASCPGNSTALDSQ